MNSLAHSGPNGTEVLAMAKTNTLKEGANMSLKTGGASRIIRCPTCGKSTRYDQSNADRPFCSTRCRTIDTAQWADEGYKIPLKPENSDSDQEVKPHLDEDEDY